MNTKVILSVFAIIVTLFIGGITQYNNNHHTWSYVLWGIAIIFLIYVVIFYVVKKIKNKSKENQNGFNVVVTSAHQPSNAKRENGYINVDIEFHVKTNNPPIKIAKIQLLEINKFIETNNLKYPYTQMFETESYVASFALDYYLFLDNVVHNREDQYFLCVLANGVKRISNKFGFGNSSTLLLQNKPDGIKLEIK
jgi:lipopolysaccharide export LptBFGC system permease protein LptF